MGGGGFARPSVTALRAQLPLLHAESQTHLFMVVV
jgi:hypothetical protein